MNWPVELPTSLLISNYSEKRLDSVLRNQYNGRPKARNLYSGVPFAVSGGLLLTYDQKVILDDFYNVQTNNGTVKFLWKRPNNLVSENFEFIDQPDYSAVSCDLFPVNLSFIVYPNA